jgi:hypothetical protein
MNEKIDHLLGFWLVRLLGLILLAIALPSIVYFLYHYWGGIEVAPFGVSQGSEAERLSFAFARAREWLETKALPDRAPMVILRDLDVDFPEVVEIGEVKPPLAAVIRPLKRPKVRVTGYWGGPLAIAQATIERRNWFFSYKRASLAPQLPIPFEPGGLQDFRLQQFARDVLEMAASTV